MELLINGDNVIKLLDDLDETVGTFEALNGHYLKIRYLRTNEDGVSWFRVWIDRRQEKGLNRIIPRLEIQERYKAR
jgi:hypothetical protein